MNPNLQRALLLYQQSRFEMAEGELRQAIAAEPNDSYAHSLLALCLARREQFQAATDEARQAIGLQPDSPYAHYAHAVILYDRHRPAEALQAIQEAIRLDANDADYFSLLAAIHFGESRWQDALSAAEQGLQTNPEHIGCTNLRAMAMVKLGRRAEAGATIATALAKNPESAVTHANQGWTLLHQGEPKKALEHFREALRLDPENEWARHGIVEALKARHFIYAIMLKYFLWMSRFRRQAQWGIIVGAYVGYRLLGIIAQSQPSLAPWILPLQIAYIVFALMTWMASPFFDLILRLNPFGRLVLTREQTLGSTWFGLTLLCALLCFGVWLWKGGGWILGALMFGLLLIPVSSIYRCTPGTPRRIMAGLTVALAISGVAGLALMLTATPTNKEVIGLGALLLIGSVAGSGLSTWITNFLRTRRLRR
jgi:tetratricopeptide (TPR) repeat protein